MSYSAGNSFAALLALGTVLVNSPDVMGFDWVWTHFATGSGNAQIFDGEPAVYAVDTTTSPSDERVSFHASRLTAAAEEFYVRGLSSVYTWGVGLQLHTTLALRYTPPASAPFGGNAEGSLASTFEFVLPLEEVSWSYTLESRDSTLLSVDASVTVENVAQGIELLSLTSEEEVETTLSGEVGDVIRVTVSQNGSGTVKAGGSAQYEWWQFYMIITLPDCNNNDVPDFEDVLAEDCNANGVPDDCDTADGTSEDCNGNSIPDECLTLEGDCNGNNLPDACDTAAGTSEDCNYNEVPDECEPDEDCNENGVRDICDIGDCPSGDHACDDCDANSVPDACDLADGADDCQSNGILDICEIVTYDCNGNSVPDDCDIADGADDCQPNGVLDTCEIPTNDCNDNGIPDDCDATPLECYFAPLVLPSNTVHHARKHRFLSIDATTSLPLEVSIKVEIAEMNRCQNDLRRSCIDDEDCPTVCAAKPNLHSCGDGSICPDGVCIESGPCGPHPNVGLSWYVQEPQTRGDPNHPYYDCPNGTCDEEDYYARVGPDPWGSDWKDECEAAHIPGWSGGCATLHISGCEIVPGVVYEVSACHSVLGYPCSDPLQAETTRKPEGAPHYGDVAGGVTPSLVFEPPDGYVGVNDVLAYLLTNQNWGTSNLPQAHPTWIDIHGSGTGIPPQYILSVTDMAMVINAWVRISPYEDGGGLGGLAPGDCP